MESILERNLLSGRTLCSNTGTENICVMIMSYLCLNMQANMPGIVFFLGRTLYILDVKCLWKYWTFRDTTR